MIINMYTYLIYDELRGIGIRTVDDNNISFCCDLPESNIKPCQYNASYAVVCSKSSRRFPAQ